MAKAKEMNYTKRSLEADAAYFKEGKFKKTDMSLDWMDAYVAIILPDEIEGWVKYRVDTPTKTVKINDQKTVKRPDVLTIRKHFIETYFPDYTDEAIKARKEAQKELSFEDKLRDKLRAFQEKANG